MSKIPFTEEQIKLLQENPYTYNVTPNTLYLTKEFKELFYQEYRKGKLPRQILEEHGFPMSILGESRISGISSMIRKEAKRPEGFREGPTSRRELPLIGDTPEAAIRDLLHEVQYLRQEVEFLKKITSIKNTRK
ncbi:HTH domain-containing protein [Bacilliculturomica massiliensis]|uniref:HTH domain-containing protein n=1 Tax=Bacilliculturomica massiliensis TaxID=1917867 RepID=UPI00103269DC|nr:HTH domain-containing protein [Bacilliculturomica massiliensis]